MKKRKLNLTNYGHALGITSASLVAFIALALLCPAIQKDIYATEYCKGDNGYVECDTTNTINTYARIAPVVSVGMQSDVVMDIVPKSSGVTIEQPVTVTVSTNSSEGYSLYMKTLDATNSMTSTSGTNTNVIAPVDGGEHGVDIATLASQGNVWGYGINHSSVSSTETLYQAVPMSQDQPIRKTSSITETNATDTLELTFGLHVDTTLPSGTYTNKVLVSAVANPVTITSLDELVFMQDMTTDICSNTAYDATGETNPTKADIANPVTKQLIDTRDGKKYWVAKLADGNCWMTQNLALNLGVTPDAETEAKLGKFVSKLTTADTEITKDWTVIGSTNEFPDFVFPSKNTRYASWNLGNYIDVIPNREKGCLDYTGEKYAHSLSECAMIGMLELDSSWQPGFTGQPGDFKYNTETGEITTKPNPDSTTFITVDTEKKIYDSHYLVGNFYTSWTEFAGGPFQTAGGYVMDTSICPKGWIMPRDLLGVTDANNLGEKTLLNLGALYGQVKNGYYGPSAYGLNLYAAPFHYPFPGVIKAYNGYNNMDEIGMSNSGQVEGMRTAGIDGGDGGSVTYVHIGHNDMTISSNDYSTGFSLRCVAK